MLSIRLTRTGKVHEPHYRIVVQEKRSKLNGKAIDILGHYHPTHQEKTLVIDKEKAESWLKQGAQPSDTVTNLMVKAGILDASRKVHSFFTPTKKEVIPEAPKAEVTEEVIVEEAAPAEAVALEPAESEAEPAADSGK